MLDSSSKSGDQPSRRDLIALGLSAGAAAAMAACGTPAAPAPQPGTTKPATPKRLADKVVFANNAMAPGFDPAYSLSFSGSQMADQIFDTLITFDDKGTKILPSLAHQWKRIDPLTMEFKLRDDVKFSNGEDFTADAVKWTLDRIMSSKNPNHQGTKNSLGPLADAEVPNSTTIRIKTKAPDPILLNHLVNLFILPPKFGQQAGDQGLLKQGIGTGSFKGVEVVQGQRMVLESWDGSWRGPSKIKQAVMLQFNEDAAMIAALKAGDIDIVFRVEPDQIETLKGEFNFATQSYGSATSASILQPNGPALRDKRVREALNLAVNRDEFVGKLMLGYADLLQGQLIEKGMFGYHDGLKPPPYDPDRARALLREAGYSNLSLTVGCSVGIRSIAEGLVGYLQTIGLDPKINVYETSVNTRQITQHTSDSLYLMNRDYFRIRDFDGFGPNLVLQEQPHFPNEEFKKLYLASRAELDDEKRAGLIRKMSEMLYSEFGVVFLFVRHLITPYTKKIAKLPRHFDLATWLWDVEKEA